MLFGRKHPLPFEEQQSKETGSPHHDKIYATFQFPTIAIWPGMIIIHTGSIYPPRLNVICNAFNTSKSRVTKVAIKPKQVAHKVDTASFA
jgi:hypothetical protein